MVAAFLAFIKEYPAFGGIIGSAISTIAVFLVAHVYTKSLKRNEATLEFNRRFHELLSERNKIDLEYVTGKNRKGLPGGYYRRLGFLWWNRFFDLMLFQFHFFQEGLVNEVRFAEWMNWRRHDFQLGRNEPGSSASAFATCGVSYEHGWDYWKNTPAHAGNSFIAFLDAIHDPNAGPVSDIITRHKIWWCAL